MSNLPFSPDTVVTAFDRERKVAQGAWLQVQEDLARYCAREPAASLMVFNDASGQRVPWPPLAPASAVGRLVPVAASTTAVGLPAAVGASGAAGPLAARAGRPRLGVVAREVTLLPEHWQWLATQPGGASASLRRLVDLARQEAARRQRHQQACQAAFQCLTELAPRLEQVDEALAAVYAADAARFEHCTQFWPPDWRDYVRQLGFPPEGGLDVHCTA